MHIAHAAIWPGDLERLSTFYSRLLGAQPGAPYRSLPRAFEPVFLAFASGARVELLMESVALDPDGNTVEVAV